MSWYSRGLLCHSARTGLLFGCIVMEVAKDCSSSRSEALLHTASSCYCCLDSGGSLLKLHSFVSLQVKLRGSILLCHFVNRIHGTNLVLSHRLYSIRICVHKVFHCLSVLLFFQFPEYIDSWPNSHLSSLPLRIIPFSLQVFIYNYHHGSSRITCISPKVADDPS
jgi:hypothetical protein